MTARVPSLVSGIDVFSLPLSPREGFVLSRVDGVSSVEDISIMVGVKQDELLAILSKLAELKVVKLPWVVAKAKPATPPPKAGVQSQPSPKTERARSQPPPADKHPAVQRVLAEPFTPLYAASELEVAADIDVTIKRRILNVFYGLEGKDYYQLLGLDQSAEKKDIRAAYFELSKLFHPDSLFGKDLGSFKTKMEVVFKRLTEAYEVLGRNQRRKEYDEYLASTQQTHAIQEQLDHVATESPPAAAAAAPAPEPPRSFDSEPPPRAARASNPNDARAQPKVDMRPPPTAEQRRQQARDRLRRTLGSSVTGVQAPVTSASGAPAAPKVSNPPVSTTSIAERRDSAIKGLKAALRASTGSASRIDPIVAHFKRAQDAERAGDLLGAASALQSALALDPNRVELQEHYARVSKAVARNLATNYEKQARYEEKMGKWAAAAASWDRVAEGRPEDAAVARSAAEAMLKAGGDLHKAQRHAQRAVDIAPSEVANVVVLGRVLLAAGLRLNARRELEKAVKLDPQNEMIRNLLREVR